MTNKETDVALNFDWTVNLLNDRAKFQRMLAKSLLNDTHNMTNFHQTVAQTKEEIAKELEFMARCIKAGKKPNVLAVEEMDEAIMKQREARSP